MVLVTGAEIRYDGINLCACEVKTYADAKKGEKIVLITTEPAITKDALIRLYKETGMTELGLPHTIVVVKEAPVLGTGKFDYQTAKQLAVEATTPKE